MMMTFKHNFNFEDSQVMRELERKALREDDGKYKLSAAARAIKSEKNKKTASYEPTDNLFSDLISLAIGMRERGLVKQAEELEEKITRYKIAETHLYRVHDEDGEDLMDHAHKEGDVEMAPSREDYGVVETYPSAHRKIKEKVLKQPTGKSASLQAVAEALELPLKKKVNAQAIAQQDIQKKTEQDQGAVSGIYKALAENVNALVAITDPKNFVLTYQSVLLRQDHQNTLNALTGGKYKWFIDKLNAAKNAGIDVSTPESIVQSISNKLNAGAWGSNVGEQAAKNLMINVIGVRDATGEESAEHIAGYIRKWRANLNAVVNYVKQFINSTSTTLNDQLIKINNTIKNGYQLDGTVKSYNEAIDKINELETILSGTDWRGDFLKILPFHKDGIQTARQEITQYYKAFSKAADSGRTAVSNLIPGTTGHKLSNKISQAMNTYKSAANAWASSLRALQDGKINTEQAGNEEIINANRVDSMMLSNMMENAIRKNYTVAQLISEFNSIVDGVNVGSEDDILEHALSWQAFAENKAVTAGLKIEQLTKNASTDKFAISGIPRDPHTGKRHLPDVKQRGGAFKQKEDAIDKDVIDKAKEPVKEEPANALVDKLPFFAVKKDPATLAFTDPRRAGQVATADKPLYMDDINSLGGFFNFLVNHRMYPVSRESGAAGGYTIAEWDAIFNWFRKRVDAVKSEAYMRSINDLFRTYGAFRQAVMRSRPEQENTVIPPQWLGSVDSAVAVMKGGRGAVMEQKPVGLSELSGVSSDEGIDLIAPFTMDKPLNILALAREWKKFGADIQYLDKYEQLSSDVGVRYSTFNGGNIETLASLMTKAKVGGRTLPPRIQIQNFRNLLIYFSRDMKEIYKVLPSRKDVQDGFERWFNLIRETIRRTDIYQTRRR